MHHTLRIIFMPELAIISQTETYRYIGTTMLCWCNTTDD